MTSVTPRKRTSSPTTSVSSISSTSSPLKRIKAESSSSTSTISSESLAPLQISRPTSEFPEWPARKSDIEKARQFIKRAAKASSSLSEKGLSEKVLLIPDKDADGLSAGCIVKRTLIHLGSKEENVLLHHIQAGKSPQSDEKLDSYGAKWVIVLDQGSVEGPELVKGGELGWESDEIEAVRTMIIDHHFVKDLDNECPKGALLVNASQHNPVSTSALLTWYICKPFWSKEQGGSYEIDYLAIIGTCGDLSINVSWDEPWPNFEPELKRWGKSKIGKVIAMINAPRRTPLHDSYVSWKALDYSKSPLDILQPETNPSFKRLNEARNMVAIETEKQTHTPPKFSKDSRVALLTISTPFQVHPSIATRWSGSLKGAKKLEIVMCANTGFGAIFEEEGVKKEEEDRKTELQRYVHFSCRIANAAKARGENPHIIELLHDYAARDPTFLTDLYSSGQGSFAKGHREASGGILSPPFWKRFVDLMQIGIKPTPPPEGIGKSPKKQQKPVQNNKLTNYFTKV